jgi:tetratricopeptide (TPR) repeat protein
MLFAFGGNGNMDGYFRNPVALEHMDYDLIVLDSLDASFTVFTPTEFGGLIYEAIDEFQAGDYEASGESWQKVMDLNGNYDLAYIGIGRSLLRQEKYHEAMEYFKLKWDIDNYSKAFKQYRKEWVEEHIIIIVILFFAILIVPLIVGKIRGIKREIDTADIFKKENGG